MGESASLSASLEDYIEAIAVIAAEKTAARVKDIASRLHVNSSSVTGALHVLSERGLVNYAPYELITLTPEGQTLADEVMERHQALRDFFVQVLEVEEPEAQEAACKMEHCVPPTILDRLGKFANFVNVCPRLQTKWIQDAGYFCQEADGDGNCEQCIALCLDKLRRDRAQRSDRTDSVEK